MTTLSVIITTHNRLAFLKEAVDSVRLHRDPDWQLVVVDDASDDGTYDWLNGMPEPWITAIRNETNLERSASRNAGLRAAEGRFVLFVDDDDRVAADLRKLVAALEKRPHAVAAVGRHFGFDEGGQGRKSRRPTLPYTGTLWPPVLAGWPFCGGQMLFRRRAVQDAGGWSESIVTGEDVDLFLRVAHSGPVVVRSHVILERRMHAEQWHLRDGRLFQESRRDYRRTFVDGLPAHERSFGEACLVAWTERGQGWAAYRSGQPRDAFKAQMSAIRAAPKASFTRLNAMHTCRDLLSSFVGMLLGNRVFATIAGARQAARTRFGRAPKHHKPSERSRRFDDGSL